MLNLTKATNYFFIEINLFSDYVIKNKALFTRK